MKDIYELLNDIDIDENEFEEMEVTEIEKARFKSNLKKSIKQKKKRFRWKKSAAAVAIIGLSVVSFGLTFPTYAANIPLVGDIFRFIDGGKTGIYDQYKEHSTEVNLSKESQGIKITLNDIIFDGKTVSVTYLIESEHELEVEPNYKPGDEINPFAQPFLVIKGEQGWSGNSKFSKIDNNHYAAITTASINKFTEKKEIDVELLLSGITTKSNKVLQGDWSFDLGVIKATDNNVQVINQSSEKDGVTVEVGKITTTPMSFIVYSNHTISEEVKEKWPFAEVDLQVKDDLGNQYHGEWNGGWSDDEKGVTFGNSKAFGKLDPKATKLIITPHIRAYNDTIVDGSHVKDEKTFVADDIIVDLKK
ncbi:DUF4179 domain-containing protein [Bacillus sp. 31A1R]|uniref:DUF4179 domain-containing protein n=1 Tax=Robertmurraya mangrovi TaxID=3098077 RepID=A0ABU5J089_9BACI|nr:DUF4179 domain-containing protein [Bacillus sp. 31A1R]MDZ5472829.1 DUF4179 domain-containing protein [Bacillus sp. 31A1R]